MYKNFFFLKNDIFLKFKQILVNLSYALTLRTKKNIYFFLTFNM